MFYLTKAAAPRLADGGAIINTVSAPGDRGRLRGYAAATRSATLAFTRSLARPLRGRGIRINAVDPDSASVEEGDVIAPRCVALAMRDASAEGRAH